MRLVTAAGEERGGTWHEHGAMAAETGPLLESLAVLTECHHDRDRRRVAQESGHSGLLIAVLGEVTERDRPSLTRMRHSAGGAMAVALDVPAWTRGGAPALPAAPPAATVPPPAPPLAERRLADLNGWRAVDAGPQDSVPSVWQELGAAGRAGAGRPRTFSAAPRPGPGEHP